MNWVPPAPHLPVNLDLDEVAGRNPPDSPTDSDYFSSFEEDLPGEDQEDNVVDDDWIDLDISAESAQSLSFLSDSDFQAVLKSFAEFTCQQFNNAVLNLREIQGALTNHLAFLLWRKAVIRELSQRPFYMEPEQLGELFSRKWLEDSELMHFNRQRFQSLADATTVPQLVLATFKTCFIRKRHAESLPPNSELSKRIRQNLD